MRKPERGTTEAPSDQASIARHEDRMRQHDIDRLAAAIRVQVEKFSDRRMNDGDDVWHEREIEYRGAVASTANAICVRLQLDAATFAEGCGLHVSDGRGTYSDCYPGELTREKPREGTA
jgi:hypothetical protein